MGAPLSPVIANIFLCEFETKAMQQCNLNTRPQFYRRFLDDTFLIFENLDVSKQFFAFLNDFHNNIRFTCENETNKKLSFLDISIQRTEEGFETSIFRKSSFSGKGTNYFSYIYEKYKISGIQALLYRAYELSSKPHFLHDEIDFLRKYFISNNYPSKIFNKCLEKFLSEKLDFRSTHFDVPKMKMYLELPYIGIKTEKMIRELRNMIFTYYPHVNPIFFFKCELKIRSLFPLKDKTPLLMNSGVIYK